MKLFLLICGLIAQAGFNNSAFPAVDSSISCDKEMNWVADIDTLLGLIKKEHYIYSKKELPSQLIRKANWIKENICNLSKDRILLEMEKMMYFLGDGHSYVLPLTNEKWKSSILPLDFYIFTDGVFIINASTEYKDLIGCKVTHLNKVEAKKIIKDMKSYVHQDNKMTVTWLAPSFMKLKSVYEQYGLPQNENTIKITLEESTGCTLNKTINFVDFQKFNGVYKLPNPQNISISDTLLYLKSQDKPYWFSYIKDRRAVYFQFNQVRNSLAEDLKAFSKRLEDFYITNEVSTLIIDVRHNNGGDKDILTPLYNVINNFCKMSNNKVYVITGRGTFSAAQVFISTLYRDYPVVFLGERTSSRPNFIGEENLYKLPNSKALVSISNKYHCTIPGNKKNYIPIKYNLLLDSKSYFSNCDVVIDFLFKNLVYEYNR